MGMAGMREGPQGKLVSGCVAGKNIRVTFQKGHTGMEMKIWLALKWLETDLGLNSIRPLLPCKLSVSLRAVSPHFKKDVVGYSFSASTWEVEAGDPVSENGNKTK